MINFSIIIPHKNIPDLLQRCLNSIPTRDDLEIIIVDDNSDSNIVSFDKFPGINRDNVKIFFTKEGKGAGYARNIGLKHATGKWLIFADADDFFTPHFNFLLDKYKNNIEDVIYFMPISSTISNRIEIYQKLFDYNPNFLRFAYISPWGKFIKREYVIRNGFLFDEMRWSNDAFFMTQVGITTDYYHITKESMYCVEEREGSLTREKQKSIKELRCRMKVDIRCYEYADSIGYRPSTDLLLNRLLHIEKSRHLGILMRAIHSLPPTAYHAIKRRITHNLNWRGTLYYHIIFTLSHFMPRL